MSERAQSVHSRELSWCDSGFKFPDMKAASEINTKNAWPVKILQWHRFAAHHPDSMASTEK